MNGHRTLFGRRAETLLCTAITVFVTFAVHVLPAQTSDGSNWQSKATERLKAIYDRGEFRAKNYRPTWLSDSSGFVIEEGINTNRATHWLYEAQSGERRAWKPDERLPGSDDRRLSPQGTHRLEIQGAKLLAVDLENGKETLLASGSPDRDVAYRNPVWCPDGSRVTFIEADFTDVRQRSVLVPGDPSYPEVQKHRFARVGGEIEKLRVGVVNADGTHLTWLPIECPEEGIYLGQVEWAGNSDEVLVEKFSRFRDKRDFLLISPQGSTETIFSETNEAWVESSQGKNSGLVWIQDGQGLVVISEKDGWRHAYRYSRDGKDEKRLTREDHDIIDRAVIDEEGGWYYYYASPDDAAQRYLYRVALDGCGKSQRIRPRIKSARTIISFRPMPSGRSIVTRRWTRRRFMS